MKKNKINPVEFLDEIITHNGEEKDISTFYSFINRTHMNPEYLDIQPTSDINLQMKRTALAATFSNRVDFLLSSLVKNSNNTVNDEYKMENRSYNDEEDGPDTYISFPTVYGFANNSFVEKVRKDIPQLFDIFSYMDTGNGAINDNTSIDIAMYISSKFYNEVIESVYSATKNKKLQKMLDNVMCRFTDMSFTLVYKLIEESELYINAGNTGTPNDIRLNSNHEGYKLEDINICDGEHCEECRDSKSNIPTTDKGLNHVPEEIKPVSESHDLLPSKTGRNIMNPGFMDGFCRATGEYLDSVTITRK